MRAYVDSTKYQSAREYVEAVEAAIQYFQDHLGEYPSNTEPAIQPRQSDGRWVSWRIHELPLQAFGYVNGSEYLRLLDNVHNIEGLHYAGTFPDDEAHLEVARIVYGGVPAEKIGQMNWGETRVFILNGRIVLVIDGEMRLKMAGDVSPTESGYCE